MIRHNSYMNTIHTKISQNTTFSRSYLLCTFNPHLSPPFIVNIHAPLSFQILYFALALPRTLSDDSNNSHQNSAVASFFSSTWAPAKSAWTRKRRSINIAHPSILARLSLKISKTRYLLYLKSSKDLLAFPSHRWIERFFKEI